MTSLPTVAFYWSWPRLERSDWSNFRAVYSVFVLMMFLLEGGGKYLFLSVLDPYGTEREIM